MFGGCYGIFVIHFIPVDPLLRYGVCCTGEVVNAWDGTGSQTRVLNIWLGACVLSYMNTTSNRMLFGGFF
jgi:hypothetical protein